MYVRLLRTILQGLLNTRNRFSSIELPIMNLGFGRWGVSFLGASVFNSLPSDIRNLNSRLLFGQEANESFLFVIFIRKPFYGFSM